MTFTDSTRQRPADRQTETLYKTLSDLGITPHKQGRSRVLDDEQFSKSKK